MNIWLFILLIIFNVLLNSFIEIYFDKRCHLKGCKSLSCKEYKICPFSEYTFEQNKKMKK